MKKAIIAILLSLPLGLHSQNTTLSGTVIDAQNGGLLIGATISLPDLKRGATTNEFGFYSLELPPSSTKVQFSYVGYTLSISTQSGFLGFILR
jgi:lactam utilization protein B